MASMTPTTISSKSPLHPLRNSIFNTALCNVVPALGRHSLAFCITQEESCKKQLYVSQPIGRDRRSILMPVSAVGSGLEATMTELKGSTLTFKNIEIAVESQDADMLKLRVDLTGEETQRAFGVLLSNLARSAPVLPGFRRQKGGKASKVPKNLLIDILGKERIRKFFIREIVTSAVARYVDEKNLSIKDDKISTTQTEDELNESFLPGNAFGFNVEVELVNEETEPEEPEAASDKSEPEELEEPEATSDNS